MLAYFIGMIIFACSFYTVRPNKMAIFKNSISGALDKDTLYFNGRYFLGPSKAAIYYPTKAINIKISDISSTSSDGNNVNLDISCQYMLNPNQIFDLYERFSTGYEAFYESMVKETVQQETVNWETQPDFYVSRSKIASAIRSTLNKTFEENNAYFVGFQLRAISLPSAIENAIEDTVEADQLTTTTLVQRDATLERTEAANILARTDAAILDINAEAEATGTAIKASAEAFKTTTIVEANAKALLVAAKALNLTKAQLMQLQWQKTIQASPSNSRAAVGFPDNSMMANLLLSKNAF